MKKKIKQLDFVRLLAVYMVVFMHANEFFHVWDLLFIGAFGVYICFVLSGFLYIYNHPENGSGIWTEMKDTLMGKLIKFYPLHLVTFIPVFFLNWYWRPKREIFAVKELLKVFNNLTLTQIYVPDEMYYFSYNGVSWFLASLIVIYFLSPIFGRIVRRINSVKGVYIAALIVVGIVYSLHLGIEPFLSRDMAIWGLYILPITHAFEFITGMLIARYLQLIQQPEAKTVKMLPEFGAILSILAVNMFLAGIASSKGLLNGASLGVWSALIVWVFARYDRITGAFGGKPVSFIASFSFEVYMFHQVVGRYMEVLAPRIGLNNITAFIMTIVIAVTVAYIWHIIEKTVRGKIKARKTMVSK